jgi:hypothetical protein
MPDRIPAAFGEDCTRRTCAVQGALMVLPGRMQCERQDVRVALFANSWWSDASIDI